VPSAARGPSRAGCRHAVATEHPCRDMLCDADVHTSTVISWLVCCSRGRVQASKPVCLHVCHLSRAVAAGADLELQPNASAPLLRNSKARREWIEQEMELCSTSWQYQKVRAIDMCCVCFRRSQRHTCIG
jgi:hypothetical protein